MNRRCREKFNSTLRCLAVREGDVRQRLRGAYRYLHMLSENELPADLRQEWKAILEALTKQGPEFGPNGEVYRNALDNTMNHIRNSTGRRIAERIYALVRHVK